MQPHCEWMLNVNSGQLHSKLVGGLAFLLVSSSSTASSLPCNGDASREAADPSAPLDRLSRQTGQILVGARGRNGKNSGDNGQRWTQEHSRMD